MTYQLQPTAVRAGHWRLSIAFIALIAVSVVGAGFASRRPEAPPAVKATSSSSAQILALSLPDSVACHEVAPPDCVVAARAAVALLAPDGGRITAAEVWRSLLCNSTFECPPTLLTPESTPLGSVVLTFDSGPAAWINVVSKPQVAPVSSDAVLAWLVRWR